MFWSEIARVLGAYFQVLALVLVFPFIVSVFDEEVFSAAAFLETIFLTLTLATFCYLFGRKSTGKLYRREGVAVVALIWFLTPLIGALPFYLSHTLEDPAQAYFEAASGFTTTGLTVCEPKRFNENGLEIPIVKTFNGIEKETYSYYGTIDPVRDPHTGAILREGIEAMPRGILFWRSFTQWLGGVGIMVLFVAVLPALGVGGKLLYQSEATGPVKESLTPRIKETAIRLWMIYVGLSLLQLLSLFAVKPDIGLFDATCLTFSTLSTGGFCIHNEGITAYHSPALEWVLVLFMFLGSVNFSLFHYILKGRFSKLLDFELGLYLVVIAAISLFTIFALLPTLGGVDGVRSAVFQMVSAITSTGFFVHNYDLWPGEIQVLMLITMYLGGMSGSTAGGIKMSRWLVLFRASLNKVESIFRPDTVRAVKIGDREITPNTANTVFTFFFLFIALSVLAVFFYSIDGIDPETSLGLIACNINNTGLAFRGVGPSGSAAFLSTTSLFLSSFWMILGRLELFAILVLFVPAFWKVRP